MTQAEKVDATAQAIFDTLLYHESDEAQQMAIAARVVSMLFESHLSRLTLKGTLTPVQFIDGALHLMRDDILMELGLDETGA